ncbi:MAG: lactate racemase domain-containing protein [Myxococcota bacterium]|nr:lactate racemase domain-containing protein [Myxococcota bacterium]
MLLPYGRSGYPLDLARDLGGRTVHVVTPPVAPGAIPDLASLLTEALRAPLGRPPLAQLVGPGGRVTVIVSDATRREPRAAFLRALRRELPAVQWTIAVATGTHGPAELGALELPPELVREACVVNHDGHRPDDLLFLGTTSRGTPVRVHRCVVDTDLVIATGCIRPHYFAGFGAGVKAIFPGLGEAAAIRINHRLKTAPRSRAGIVDDNPCRLDLEEAVAMVPAPTFLLDGVCAADGAIHAAVAGDPVLAFRHGTDLARPWFSIRAPRAQVVIASDSLPVTSSLYQAAKIATAVAPLVEPDGALVLVAECADGVEPIETVNESIFRIGVLPRLANGVTIYLVSALPASIVERTLVKPAPSIAAVLAERAGSVTIVPTASQLIIEPTS